MNWVIAPKISSLFSFKDSKSKYINQNYFMSIQYGKPKKLEKKKNFASSRCIVDASGFAKHVQSAVVFIQQFFFTYQD